MTMMNRHAKRHIEAQIKDRFPGRDVTVEDTPDGSVRISIYADGRGTLVAVCGDEPSTVLAGLLTVPLRAER